MIIKNINYKTTNKIAKIIGQIVEVGNIIVLSGYIGAGKTNFTKNIALGLKIFELIKSPTYIIIKKYLGKKFPLYHIDIYRYYNNIKLIELEIEDYLLNNNDGLTIIEWGEKIFINKKFDYLKIEIKRINKIITLKFKYYGIKSKKLFNNIKNKINIPEGI